MKGEKGMAKSAIMNYVANYCIDREFFADGAYIINNENKHTAQAFQSHMLKICGSFKKVKDFID